jgi:hypothetical protein
LAIGNAIAKPDMTIQCSFGKSALGFCECATLCHGANFQNAETITAPLTYEKRKIMALKFTASLVAGLKKFHSAFANL